MHMDNQKYNIFGRLSNEISIIYQYCAGIIALQYIIT